MPSPEMRKNLAAIGALVLPVVVVKLTTLMLGHSALSAQATMKAAHPVAEVSAPAMQQGQNSERQRNAAKHVQSLKSQPFGPAPLLFAPAAAAPVSADPTTPSVVVTPSESPNDDVDPVPQFIVNAVMSSTTGQRALINGRPYRVGEQVRGTTWTVTAIESAKRSVTLADRNGRQATVSVELPQ